MKIEVGQATEHLENKRWVKISLGGDEVAAAIAMYLVSKGIDVTGPRTITVNSELCRSAIVVVDPSGSVVFDTELIK